MRKLVFFLILSAFISSKCYASCDAIAGQYAKILNCAFENWKDHPDRKTTLILLNDLYYVYFTDGTNKSMRTFFDGLREGSGSYANAVSIRSDIIDQYRPVYAEVFETAALPLMPQNDALALFVLSQTDPQSVPDGMIRATYLTIYQHAEVLFALGLATSGQYSVLPPNEYVRMLEIVKRMSWVSDPYMKAMNHYFQGVLYLNMKDVEQGIMLVTSAAAELQACLDGSQETVSKKRILMRLADASVVLHDWEKAENAYISILKMNPQDWDALMGLSKLLYRDGKCKEPGVSIEASIGKKQDRFHLTIRCGNQEFEEEDREREDPVMAKLMNLNYW